MEEQTGLKDEMKRVRELLEKMVDQGIAKKGKQPWSSRLGKAKVKKNWITVQYINENLSQEFFKVPISEMTLMAKECPRIALPEHIISFKGKPWIIIPAWSVEPFSPTKNYEETVRDKMLSSGYKLLMNKMKTEQITAKKGIGGGAMLIILGVLVLGGLAYYLFKGGNV